jgi:formylglycine-generating enzyme required for sulfatase activity
MISLSLSGHEGKESLLTLDPGASRELSFTLQPKYGIVFVTTEPPDAELLIDGRPHGRATGRLRLTATQHILTVQKISAAGHEMIRLGPAVFTMGASRREPGRRANEQKRQVEITRPFYLAAREVTNEEFRKFKPEHRSGLVGGHTLDGGNQPVVMVTWEDAARYCNWLSKQEGLALYYREEKSTMVAVSPATHGYRLPLESEWAYAARVAARNTPSRYPWEGTFPPRAPSGNYSDESEIKAVSLIWEVTYPSGAMIFMRHTASLVRAAGM